MSTSPKTFKQLETECAQLREIIENLQGAVSQRQEEYEALCVEKAAAFFAERVGLKVGDIFFATHTQYLQKVVGFCWDVGPCLEARRVNGEQYSSRWVESEFVDCKRWSLQEVP